MEVLVSVYFQRKALFWSSVYVGGGLAIAAAKGWVGVPEPLRTYEKPLLTAGFAVFAVLVGLLTSLLTGRRYQSAAGSANGPAPTISYSLPYFGHLMPLLFGRTGWLVNIRDANNQNIFALKLAGVKHILAGSVFSADKLEEQGAELADDQELASIMRKNAFGFDNEPLSSEFYDLIFTQEHAKSLANKAVVLIRENVPDLMTFNESQVDQLPWERVSMTTTFEVDGGTMHSEANMLPLTREFVGQIMNAAYAGVSFLDDHPTFHESMLALEKNFCIMTTGLPRWAPWPGVPAGHIGRRNLIRQMAALRESWEREMLGEDVITTATDIGDFSAAYTAAQQIMDGSGVSPTARACTDLSIIWALNASARDLVFWMLLHVVAEPGLADRIRDETRPYCRASRPSNDFNLPEPPRLDIDMDGLSDKCALLNSCFMETVRMYNTAWSVKQAKQNFSMTDESAGMASTYHVKKGDHVDVSNKLLNTDIGAYYEPKKWKPSRFVNSSGKADWGHVKHNNGMWRMNGTGEFARRLTAATVASVLAVWNFEPASKMGLWVVPGSKEAPLTARPAGDVRVKITRRDLEQKQG
ncbi:cytochrome P450 [Phyllosticta citrichinensis]|uniref:Cytochrome P450 n=1 Tax=Phyllosticta citrichinensis TaxID=1130410 RepID=A0ABR1XXA3_9PEZI